MTLFEKQATFSILISQLIQYANSAGFQVTLGEAWRSPETAQIYAREGKGIDDSVHCLRLAMDLNLFKDGNYLTDTDSYEPLGIWWEAKTTSEFTCVWGGRFQRQDGNHFSIANDGAA